MFKFDFDVDDDGVEPSSSSASQTTEPEPQFEPFTEIPIVQLVDALPGLISYSPIPISLSSTRRSTTLLRRDLFDARYQLIAEGAGDADSEPKEKDALGFIDNPSDLVPGVYEGGLKTWECSLDLVDYLDGLKDRGDFAGLSVLELGCGTALPSLYVFRKLLQSEPEAKRKTELHLQDYNPSVLQLVTLPNLFLTWYASHNPGSIDLTLPGEVPITDELKSTFLSSLSSRNITVRFFSGSWSTFKPQPSAQPYDVLLTSETIYRVQNLPSLVKLMKDACVGDKGPESERSYLCLVAAKILYFGVGGGVPDFLAAVGAVGGEVETVLERKAGVTRKVMKVRW